MEKILRIEETIFEPDEKYHSKYAGYQIITDQQTIKIGISEEQCCCESWGYLITNDNIDDFIGSELLNIVRVDTALNNKKIEELECLDEGGAMFINFETTKGLFQIVVYNAHNGYYGHGAVLISKQLNHETCL
jgi:hypothetical protein